MVTSAEAPPVPRLIALWLQQARDHAVILLDAGGRITHWLGAAENVLGWPAAEALGRGIAMIFTPEDREKGFDAYERKVAAEDHYSEDSRWHLRQDGTRIWASGSVMSIRDDGGELIGFVKVLRDMTDQRAHTERFEHEVQELGAVREQTRTFIRTLGHEFRNPIGVISNAALVLDRIVSDERGRKMLEQIRRQLDLLNRMTTDLMDVTRLELGKMQLERRPLDICALLARCVDMMQPGAQDKKIAMEAVLPPTELMVEADPDRLQQVVVNLLHNAIKYTHQGGSIWVKATKEGDEIVCRVQDSGIGIFPPVLPRLFDLFSQADEGVEMRQGGIGVGLALVRQLVELHGGTVQAKSPGLGKGAEFSFRLPVNK